MLPTLFTPPLLSSLRLHPTLPPSTWYIISSVLLSSLNRPDEIPLVVSHAFTHPNPPSKKPPSDTEKRQIADRIREGILKATVITGMPKTINAQQALHAALPTSLQIPPSTSQPPTPLPSSTSSPTPTAILHRGDQFFSHLYGPSTTSVLTSLGPSATGSPSLTHLVRLLYGHLLSDDRILSPSETSAVVIAALVPDAEGEVGRQLKGHLRGGTRLGLSAEEVRTVRAVAVDVCKRAGVVWRGGEVAKL